MGDICVMILTDSELPLISLLARRLARASKSYHHIKNTLIDIFSHCGSRKTTACTENKFSNCFQFLLFHWLRHNPAASHSRRLQLSFFSIPCPFPSYNCYDHLNLAAVIPQAAFLNTPVFKQCNEHLSSLWLLRKNAKFCSLCHFCRKHSIVIFLYLYFASTENPTELLLIFKKVTIKHACDVTIPAAYSRKCGRC